MAKFSLSSTKRQLTQYLREHGERVRGGETRDELLHRAVMYTILAARQRHRHDETRRALLVLRGQMFTYPTAEAVRILEEALEDMVTLADALSFARFYIHDLYPHR